MKKIFLLSLVLLITTPCLASLIDVDATTETQALYAQLQSAQGNTMYLVQQFNTQEDWVEKDVFTLTGKYPYVMGFDFGYTPGGDDGRALFADAEAIAKNHYAHGGIITICWHPRNPVTGGFYNDTSGNALVNSLPGGSARSAWLAKLDSLASFLNNFKDSNGVKIPVLVRMLHEPNLSGSFWWGTTTGNAGNYISLFRDMVVYLRDTKSVHNAIYVWSPAGFHPYIQGYYPGNSYVDVNAVDSYCGSNVSSCISSYVDTYDQAVLNGKVFAIAEGYRHMHNDNGTRDDWSSTAWTDWFFAILGNFKANKAAYAGSWTSKDYGPSSIDTDGANFVTAMNPSQMRLLTYSEFQRAVDVLGKTTVAGTTTIK